MQAAPSVLVTGFEPFAGEPINPSAQIARALDGRTIAGHRVVGEILPCRFVASNRALEAAMARVSPRLVVAMGQAGGRPSISLERVAINVDDARIPDNAGAQPIDVPIVPGGPAAHFSRLPIKALARALRDAGIAADVSQTAGTFVCNHVFYGMMHALAGRAEVRAGFVHVPFLPEQAARAGGAPSMTLDTMIRGVELLVLTALTTERDELRSGGATH